MNHTDMSRAQAKRLAPRAKRPTDAQLLVIRYYAWRSQPKESRGPRPTYPSTQAYVSAINAGFLNVERHEDGTSLIYTVTAAGLAAL